MIFSPLFVLKFLFLFKLYENLLPFSDFKGSLSLPFTIKSIPLSVLKFLSLPLTVNSIPLSVFKFFSFLLTINSTPLSVLKFLFFFIELYVNLVSF